MAGRVALVTGAGRGIGRALSLGLVGTEVSVAILARSEDELNEVARAANALGAAALGVRTADMGDQDQVADAAGRVQRELGTVDVLIDNAAVVWPLGPTSLIDPVDWAAAIAINVIGPVTLTRALLPEMLERGWGRIVNVSSGIAAHPAAMIGGNAYAATKAALGATRSTWPPSSPAAASPSTPSVRNGRHHNAGLDPQPATGKDRRSAARPLHQSVRTGLTDHPRSVRASPPRPPRLHPRRARSGASPPRQPPREP